LKPAFAARQTAWSGCAASRPPAVRSCPPDNRRPYRRRASTARRLAIRSRASRGTDCSTRSRRAPYGALDVAADQRDQLVAAEPRVSDTPSACLQADS
jgi:hypothetical protein